ncbi:MAG: glycosyltransferase family 39 protein [Desulfarculus sp.]|nr:glycosyltransferase family 39 protein [Desulfarculus sp.]
MKISAHILPRRVILALILLLGWGLRLWGLAWGPDQSGAGHPDEWTWQVIEGLSWSQPTYQGIWTQAFFSLAALVRGAISTLAGWLGVWLGEVRTSTELAISARLAGRLTAALLGGAQVWVAYLVGRRFFDSVATGLLAAAVLAVSPLLVAQGHYLSLDVPLGLAVMFCLWTAWKMVDSPGPRVLCLAGLALGLTLTTKASGVLVLPVFVGAYALVLRRQEPGLRRAALYWPAAWLGGLGLGLVLGYPGFLVRLPEVGDVLSASFSAPSAPGGDWWAYLAGRWSAAQGVLGRAVGLELLLLWLVAAGLMIWRRQWPRLLLMIFPPLYLLAGLTVLKGPVEGQQAVWLPVAALAACWPLVVACRRLPGRWWPVAGVSLLGCLLCLTPLWRSLGVGYIFWQQDTFGAARFWLQANLPPGAQVLAGPRGPLNLFPGAQPLPAKPAKLPPDWGRQEPAYLVLYSLGPDGDPSAADPAWRDFAQRFELLKRFDLRAGWGPGIGSEGPSFPRWVSPAVEVYASRPPSPIPQPLALWRPVVGQERSYALLPADLPAYSRAENVMWLKPGGLGQRVLRSQAPLGEMGLTLDNQGQDLAVVEVRQGLFSRRQLSIYPGQELDLPLEPLPWPFMANGFYPVRVALRRGGDLLARLDWDPLLLGRRALEAGHHARAAALLQRAVAEQGGGFDALALLAGAQARLGLWEEAGRSLAALSGPDGQPARAYQALAAREQSTHAADWLARFGQFTGYHGQLLRQATSRSYAVQGPLCQSEGQEVPLSGEGYHGSFLRRPGKPGGHLKLWLDNPMPAGQFQADLKLTARGAPAGAALALAEIWAHDYNGSRQLASRRLTSADMPGGQGQVSLPISLTRAGGRLEVRLEFLSAQDLRLQELSVGVDLAAHMRHVLRWYHEASGRVALQAGRFAAAVAAFEALLDLDPGFSEAYLPLAQALIDSGRLEQAQQRVRQAEEIFFSQPEALARVRDLYQVLRREGDVARVDRRLRDLRPSLKREARFASGLVLLGYDQGQSSFQRGEQVDLSYYWRVWAKPPLNYYIFVHLKGPDRIIPFDHLLDHGRQPMPGLAPGTVVREDYRITIPADAPPGRYRLLVGMWDPSFTGNRVPVTEGEGAGGDEVTLTTVQIR